MGRKKFSFGLALHDKSPAFGQSPLHDTKSKIVTVISLIKFEYNIANSGRKNFSFGLALHDKKSKIRISPSRIIDFSFGSALQGSKGQRS